MALDGQGGAIRPAERSPDIRRHAAIPRERWPFPRLETSSILAILTPVHVYAGRPLSSFLDISNQNRPLPRAFGGTAPFASDSDHTPHKPGTHKGKIEALATVAVKLAAMLFSTDAKVSKNGKNSPGLSIGGGGTFLPAIAKVESKALEIGNPASCGPTTQPHADWGHVKSSRV
jgi:hypothetical protein